MLCKSNIGATWYMLFQLKFLGQPTLIGWLVWLLFFIAFCKKHDYFLRISCHSYIRTCKSRM